MGTRHLICVVTDKEYKIAQYGQFDGYPSGHGSEVLNFLLKNKENLLNSFKEKVKNCTVISPDEHKALWVECGADPESNFVTMDVSKRMEEKYLHLTREASSEILNIVNQTESGNLKVNKNLEFAGDSLFCEWGYVIDLDKETFEVYRGFNKEALNENERFYFLNDADEKYAPIKLLKEYSLHDLPSLEQFIEDCSCE